MGFKQSVVDHAVFHRHTSNEHTIAAVATDDMALTSKQMVDAKKFKTEIRCRWDITDHRPINWFLGFEIKHDREARTISINQHAYIEGIVEKYGLTNAKPITTPMEPGIQLSTDQGPSTLNQLSKMRGIPYAQAVGSVLWPAVVS